jgi:adenine deaminase
MTASELLSVARGDRPADLVLRNARIVNVYSGEIEQGDIACAGGRIAGIGPGYRAHETHDLAGAFVAPGLIDAHVHIESSLCVPSQFAAAVVPRGVTCAIVDPHEIANVAGIDGIHFMLRNSRGLPLTVVLMAPSCVPATNLASSGAELGAGELADLLANGAVHGLAEVMNYPSVNNGAAEVMAKIAAFRGTPIDGHAPHVHGRSLNAYIAAGIGSDHECTTVAEASEKLARGLYILIREATNARNLHTLLPLITPSNSRRICFCTDDRMPRDLLQQGSVDYMVREAIAYGIAPVEAIRMATLNVADWFRLDQRGAIAPGRAADMVVVDDLARFEPRLVFADGRLVARDGRMIEDRAPELLAGSLPGALRIDWHEVDLRIVARGDRVRAIGVSDGQLVTDEVIVAATIHEGQAVADPDRDLLKLAVIERHNAQGNLGLGFIHGMGLRRGALAGSVAHDHHNLIVAGADDTSMYTAARRVAELGGGLVVALDDRVTAELPLPVAGLMSDRPIREVAAGYDALLAAAAAQGSPLHDPFMALSFMALEVIPKLKLTDQGLVDVEQFAFVDLFV